MKAWVIILLQIN